MHLRDVHQPTPELDPEAIVEREMMRRTAIVRSIVPGLSPTQALFALIIVNHVIQKAFTKGVGKVRGGIQTVLARSKGKGSKRVRRGK